jgi:hypothetical protein
MASIRRGDVQAVFEAFGGGGWAILRHSSVARGAPADVLGSQGAIRPFDPWDGLHLCADDWHVILVADIEGGDASFTRQDADRIMATITVRFVLDGDALATTRTAIKRFLDPDRFDLQEAYYFQEGRIMSPDELGVGEHELRCEVTIDGQVDFDNTIRFVVDAAGEGACVES